MTCSSQHGAVNEQMEYHEKRFDQQDDKLKEMRTSIIVSEKKMKQLNEIVS